MRVWEGGIEFGEFGEVCENDMVSLGEKKVSVPCASLRTARSDEPFVRPRLAFIIGQRGKQTGPVERSPLRRKIHVIRLFRFCRNIGEGTKEQWTLIQLHERLTLHAADGRKLGGLVRPRQPSVIGETREGTRGQCSFSFSHRLPSGPFPSPPETPATACLQACPPLSYTKS